MDLFTAATVFALIASPGYGDPGSATVDPGTPAPPEAPMTTGEAVAIPAEPTTSDPEAPAGETVVVIPAAPEATAPSVQPQPAPQAIVDPLPPPPEALPRAAIRSGPWRGRWWFSLRLGLGGPLPGGQRPARATATSIIGGADLGWRVNNWLGLGTGISDQAHDSEQATINTPSGPEGRVYYGHMLYWDVLFARVFLPVKRRFQPFAEIGGSLASYARPTDGHLLGGALRSGIGFDGWVTPNVTVGAIANYRYTVLEQKFADGSEKHPRGHGYQLLFELGFHW